MAAPSTSLYSITPDSFSTRVLLAAEEEIRLLELVTLEERTEEPALEERVLEKELLKDKLLSDRLVAEKLLADRLVMLLEGFSEGLAGVLDPPPPQPASSKKGKSSVGVSN